jgi:hypothetical protein
MKPFVSTSAIVIAFEQNLAIRRRVFEFEDSLESVFKKPFQVIPVPDNYNSRFPRFQAESHNGHSTLEVSQQELRIETNYDAKYATDLPSIGQYVTDRVAPIKDLRSEKVMYAGLVLTLDFELGSLEINHLVSQHGGFKAIDENTREFAFRYSTPYMADFFLVVSCSKYIQQSHAFDAQGGGESPIVQHGIQVTLDLNSKKGFQDGNSFDDRQYDKICDTLFGILAMSSLEDYLSGNLRFPPSK